MTRWILCAAAALLCGCATTQPNDILQEAIEAKFELRRYAEPVTPLPTSGLACESADALLLYAAAASRGDRQTAAYLLSPGPGYLPQCAFVGEDRATALSGGGKRDGTTIGIVEVRTVVDGWMRTMYMLRPPAQSVGLPPDKVAQTARR